MTDVTVTPVIDYEPQIGVADDDSCGAPSPTVLRRPNKRAHPMRPRTAVAPVAPSTRRREAAAFADAALRTVLEVIDRRRPPAQVRPLLAPGLADSVVAVTRAAPARQAAAVLRRARLQACDRDEEAFEVAACYSRQSRTHAIACRVERVSTPQGRRWQLVALLIG